MLFWEEFQSKSFREQGRSPLTIPDFTLILPKKLAIFP